MRLLDAFMGQGSNADPARVARQLEGILIEGETVELAFKIVRDFMAFTQKRLLIVDVQGIRGSKIEYRTIPYRAIVSFSIETAGTFDLDAELVIWVSGLPAPIRKAIGKGADIRGIQKALARGVIG